MSSLDNYETEDKPMQCDKIENKPVQHEKVDGGEYLNKVIHGDCLEVMQKIKPKSVDMVLTDLPYGNRITGLKWDTEIDLDKLWMRFEDVCKPGYVACMFADQPFTTILINSNIKNFRFEWIWKKDKTIGFLHSNVKPMKCTEDIAVFSTRTVGPSSTNKLPYYPQGLKPVEIHKKNSEKRMGMIMNQSDINSKNNIVNSDKEYVQKFTNYPNEILEFGLPTKKQHPTEKPIDLLEYLIKTHTKVGETVLDCCAGSGTTGIACKNTGRNYILIEKSQEYIDVMHERGLE